MMKTKDKILVIGDIHGRDIWKKIVEKEAETVDKIVFIGDYFDTPMVSPEKILENFKDILEYKRQYSDKVVLLIGNHDWHYMSGVDSKCSGYERNAVEFGKNLDEAFERDEIQMSYKNGDVLFTHAGASNSWLDRANIDLKDVDNSINSLSKSDKEKFSFWKFDSTGYGEHPCQSPIWIRPNSLARELSDKWVQVVGHTQMDSIRNFEDRFILVDTLSKKEYLKLVEGEFIINKL